MATSSSARPFFTLSRLTTTTTVPLLLPFRLRLRLRLSFPRQRFSSSSPVCCLSGTGGVFNDDFVSTRKSNLDRGFLVIENLLKRIEPLDTSVISKGVSDAAKDSMKQTISTMLGLLPSDQFSVVVRVSRQPLHSLLVSSIITGYTLWNAEYRVSLMRNFDISLDDEVKSFGFSGKGKGAVLDKEVCEKRERDEMICVEDLDGISPQVLADLSPQALSYIQRLQNELSNIKEELHAMKQENTQIEYDKGTRNNLLEYLRSLDPDMVNELSQPSSIEVEEIVQQLVQSVLQRFFNDEAPSSYIGDSLTAKRENSLDLDSETCHTVGTSRDYLAKLLFWCMLLGHHLRGLENRLQLTCAVGLL